MMLLGFALLAVVLAGLLEWWLCGHSLDYVQENLYPEQSLVEPDELFYLRISLKNTGRWTVPYLRVSLYFPRGFRLHDEAHARPDADRRTSSVTYSVWLRPHQELYLRVPVSVERRGRYVLCPLTVNGGDFLGITEQVRELRRFNEIVVAPKAAPEQALQPLRGGVLGETPVRRFLYEDPILTAGCRPYTGREPMRRISWTQSARGRGLMVKQADYTTEPLVTVLVNAETLQGDNAQAEGCFSLARTVCELLERQATPYELATNAMLEYGSTAHMAYVGLRDPMKLKRGLGEAHLRRAKEILGRALCRADMPGERFLLRAVGEGEMHSRILITTKDGMPPPEAIARVRAASGGALQILTPQEGGTTA